MRAMRRKGLAPTLIRICSKATYPLFPSAHSHRGRILDDNDSHPHSTPGVVCGPDFAVGLKKEQLSFLSSGDRVLSNHQIVVIAAYLVAGDSKRADTEDIAVKANQIAPGRFSWRKYPRQINIDTVRKRLWDACKPSKARRPRTAIFSSPQELVFRAFEIRVADLECSGSLRESVCSPPSQDFWQHCLPLSSGASSVWFHSLASRAAAEAKSRDTINAGKRVCLFIGVPSQTS